MYFRCLKVSSYLAQVICMAFESSSKYCTIITYNTKESQSSTQVSKKWNHVKLPSLIWFYLKKKNYRQKYITEVWRLLFKYFHTKQDISDPSLSPQRYLRSPLSPQRYLRSPLSPQKYLNIPLILLIKCLVVILTRAKYMYLRLVV